MLFSLGHVTSKAIQEHLIVGVVPRGELELLLKTAILTFYMHFKMLTPEKLESQGSTVCKSHRYKREYAGFQMHLISSAIPHQ